MSLDSTPKSPTANSYISLVEMADYLVTRANATAWPTLQATQEALLVTATRLLDSSFDWDGVIRSRTQVLSWPRAGTMDKEGRYIDNDLIPNLVKWATAELALFLSTRDPMATPAVLGLGISDVAVGPIRITIDPDMILAFIPDNVILLLDPVGELKADASGESGGMIKLERS